jgi:hypothetical protein
MIDIKKDTIAKHIRILANLGCQFKVIESDGTEHGDLVVVTPKTRSNAPRIDVLEHVDYKTPLLAMKPGDVISIKAPPDMPLESLRSSISGCATYEFGAGSVTTTLDRPVNAVIVLRVE